MYSLLLAIIYLTFISLGLPDSLLGSGWPAMYLDIGVPVTYVGIVSMLISAMTILSSLWSNWLTRKFGTHRVTAVSVFLTAIALFGFSVSQSFWLLLVFAVPYGLGAGAIDAALNNYVAQHYTSRHMSWLHCFWSTGAIISPYVMSYALTNGTWSDGYRIIGLVQMGILAVLLITGFAWKVHKEGSGAQADDKSLSLLQVLKIPGVTYLLFGFFCYCAAEAVTMLWASTYLVQARNLDEEIAAAFGALFYIGLTSGRFLGGFLMDKLTDRKMIRLGICIAFVGILLLLLPVKNPVFALFGFGIIGFGFAPVYPCIIHATPSNFGSEHSGSVIGVQMASAYVGSTFAPPLFGYVSKFAGMQLLPVFLAVLVIASVAFVDKTFHITQK